MSLLPLRADAALDEPAAEQSEMVNVTHMLFYHHGDERLFASTRGSHRTTRIFFFAQHLTSQDNMEILRTQRMDGN